MACGTSILCVRATWGSECYDTDVADSAFGDAASSEAGSWALVDACSAVACNSWTEEVVSIGELVFAGKYAELADLNVVSVDCRRTVHSGMLTISGLG